MNFHPVARALGYILLTIAVASVVWLFGSAHAAWTTLVLGLLLQLASHLRQWIKLERWARNPSPENELVGNGVWSEPFSHLYRHERELRRQIAYWQEELARFGAAGQALTVGVIIVRSGWCIEWCNRTAEQQLGLDQRTDIGEPITHLVRQPVFLNYLAAGEFSAPLQIKSERNNDALLSIHIIAYGNNRQLIQITDITQTERVDQMRRDFVANVSHELRTPLTVLSGFIETLRELDLDADARNHYLGIMAEQSDRMQRIVQELLTLSTMEAAPPPMNERINMASLLDKLRRDAEALSSGQHKIELIQGSHADLLGAESEITSALSNLVSNAVRYTPAGGAIRIYWSFNAEEGAKFAVEDTGIGIDSAHIPRLTERFYRVDRGRSRESGGTGLGLAIVKHAIARHQATLHISSKPGQGSCFAVRFPLTRVALSQ